MVEVYTIKEAYDIMKELSDQVRPFRVVIAGTRTFDNYDLLKAKCDELLANKTNVEIVSGGNRRKDEQGRLLPTADLLGEQYGMEREHQIRIFPAKWSQGKKGGPVRNKEMSTYADACIVFWDGESRGSKNMISEAKKAGIPVRIVRYK